MFKFIVSLLVAGMLTVGVAQADEAAIYDKCAADVITAEIGPDVSVQDLIVVVEANCGDELLDAMVSIGAPIQPLAAYYIISFSIAENVLKMGKFFADGWETCEQMVQSMEEAQKVLEIDDTL